MNHVKGTIKKFPKGITLVELLIVVGIITIVSLAIIPSYAEFSQKKDFNNKVEVIVSEVMNVRNKSLSGAVHINSSNEPVDVNWGIQPDCPSGTVYYFGYSTEDDSTFQIQSAMELPENVRFSDDADKCDEIVFERLRGTPKLSVGETEKTIEVLYQNFARSITVNSSGRIVYDEGN